MEKTEHLDLPIYELDDMANLDDGYNNAMRKLDDFAAGVDNKFPIGSSDIEDGGINTVDIANGAVTSNKIAKDAITDNELAPNAVDTENILNGAVTTDKLAVGAVNGESIANGAVDTENIKDNAVTSSKIANGAITSAKIGAGAVGIANISSSSIDSYPTSGSIKLVNSDGVYEALNDLYNSLSFRQLSLRSTSTVVIPQNGGYTYSFPYSIASDEQIIGVYFYTTNSGYVYASRIDAAQNPATMEVHNLGSQLAAGFQANLGLMVVKKSNPLAASVTSESLVMDFPIPNIENMEENETN